jgi:HK97 family phage prohead protease
MNSSTFSARLIPLSTGQPGLRTALPIKVSVPNDTDDAVIDIRVSDETIDRYGEVIAASGWQLANYRKNPVIQNAHQYGDITFTIGRALRTEISGSELIQRWQFAVDVNPIARIAYGLYRGGFLNTASVGFIPIRWENGTQKTSWRRRYLEQELLEVSAVGIPANPNALILALKSSAIETDDFEQLRAHLKYVAAEVTRRTSLRSRPAFARAAKASSARSENGTDLGHE